MNRLAPVALVAALAAGAAPSAAQDVVRLGEIHGTRPPAAYFETLARNPRAYSFSRAWIARNPRLRLDETGDGPPEVRLRTRGEAGGAAGIDAAGTGPAGVLGRREEPVEGTFRFPLVLGYYADMGGPPPFSTATVQNEFFDGPNSRNGTITEYYDEVSGGRIDLRGVTFPWAQSSLTGAQVTGGVSGLGGPSRVGLFILDLMEAADDGSVDWGLYDNDGPDGVPNSGDDDGWVDLLAVFHPTNGAECDQSPYKVWSHKWSLSLANENYLPPGQRYYTTSTPSARGGMVKVDDYTIQPVYDCDGGAINEIGVFAHELGHGFGLPDLYCTAPSCSHDGIGRWGLMGSGAWGCRSPNDASLPCHMSAWSKVMLGWADVVELPPGQDLGVVTLDPVETTGRVYRMDVDDGSGEYFLLENRQPLDFDRLLMEPGLLVWHVDQPWVDARWAGNSVNNLKTHMGVWLRQADGDPWLENRGDRGDPFPGQNGVTAFHAGTVPRAFTHDGAASGLTLLDIARAGSSVAARILTRFQTIALRSEGETVGGLLSVDGRARAGTGFSFESAPFQRHTLEAAAGALLEPGWRRPFDAWADDPQAERVRTVMTGLEDAEYVARYGGVEVELAVELAGGRYGVEPGSLVSTPASDDLWFPEGTAVTLEAVPTPGFGFDRWTGALEGEPNPAVVVVDAPVQAGAAFTFEFEVPDEVEVLLEGGVPSAVALTAPVGTAPFAWSVLGGALPDGLELLPDGRLSGAPLEGGSYPVDVYVVDDRGLQARGTVVVTVFAPVLALDRLAAPFTTVGTDLTALQKEFLDRAANGNGRYDVGDLRAFLRSGAAQAAAPVASRGEIVVPMRFTGGRR